MSPADPFQSQVIVGSNLPLPITEESAPSVDGLFSLALDLQRHGQDSKAEQIYRKILASDPLQAGAYHGLGLLICRSEKRDEGLQCLERSIELAPDRAAYHNNFAVILWEIGHRKEAGTHLQHALKLDPDYADARSNLGRFLLHDKKYQAAESQLKKALELAPEHKDAVRHLRKLTCNEAIRSSSWSLLTRPITHSTKPLLFRKVMNYGDGNRWDFVRPSF